MFLRVVSAKHTVLRQPKKYTRSAAIVQFHPRFTALLSMRPPADFVEKNTCSSIQHLSILKLFAVSHLGAACSTGAQKVLAETGGAVSALTPGRAHCVTSTTRLMTGSGKVNQPEVLLTLQEKRMGGMELALLVLKLMVALLQLLDAVLKTFR